MSTTEVINDNDELLLVQVIFRHGARTPLWLSPTSQYSANDFPEGLGALSGAGKEQMFRYGQILRQRYSKYLDGIKVKNIHAKSSPVKRCLESALSVLGGLCPPDESQVWSSNLPIAKHWQPIGVSVDEPMLGVPPCPEADAMSSEIKHSESFANFLKEKHYILQKLTKHPNLEGVKRYYYAIGIYDNLTCMKAYFGDSFNQPDWIGPEEWKQLKSIRSYDFGKVSILPKRYFQLKAGLIIREILSNLNRAQSQSEINANQQFQLYSTHDMLVVPLLHVLGFYKETPSFGSGLIIELRRDHKTGNPHVCLFNVDGENNFTIQQFNLGESQTFQQYCTEEKCFLDDFSKALHDYLPDETSEPNRIFSIGGPPSASRFLV